jgi:hypothetical protein
VSFSRRRELDAYATADIAHAEGQELERGAVEKPIQKHAASLADARSGLKRNR